MKRFKELAAYNKIVIIISMIMILIFSILYVLTLSKEGIYHGDVFFRKENVDGKICYVGVIEAKDISFILEDDHTISYMIDDIDHGTYTIDKDIKVDPLDVTLKKDGEVIFKGDVIIGDDINLIDENGDVVFDMTIDTGNGKYDLEGNKIDPSVPSKHFIMRLFTDKTMHKGDISMFVYGVIIVIINIISILFEDELFRWQLHFRVKDADLVEPSSFEIISRKIVYVVFTALALMVFIIGLG